MTAPAEHLTPGVVGFIPGGSFTTDGGAWLSDPPMRCELNMEQLADLLALTMAGRDVPEQYAALTPRVVLSHLMLVAQNEVSRLQWRAEQAESAGTNAGVAVARVWRLVFATGKRKTMRAGAVRAALEGEVSDAG